jgi:hypothetical protein
MSDTIEWLARALTQLREPDAHDGPATANQDLIAGLDPFSGDPARFVEALNARVFDLSRATMVVTPGTESEFRQPLPRTPQMSLLVLSAHKRFILVADPARPVRFDD